MSRYNYKADEFVSEAVRKVILFNFNKMVAHEDDCREGKDIEAIHAMRVATRRMRSIMGLFQDFYSKKAINSYLSGLKSTARTLGRTRDYDVLIEKTQIYIQTLSSKNQPRLSPVINYYRNRRLIAHSQLINFLDGEEYANFVETFQLFLEEPFSGVKAANKSKPSPSRVYQVAPVMIFAQLAAIYALAENLSSTEITSYHQLRIEFKKFRYILEFFSPVMGSNTQKLIKPIKIIQEHLGDLNDADVALGQLRAILRGKHHSDLETPLSPYEISAIKRYMNNREKEITKLMASFPARWKLIDNPTYLKTLGLAIAQLKFQS